MATAEIGLVGLGVMGAALARNLHSRKLTVAGYNREADILQAFAKDYGDDRFVLTDDYAKFCAALHTPRRILIMVTAGPAVDAVLQSLAPHLQAEDIVVDGGNSHWSDTQRRDAWCRERGFRFVGMGVSGGEQGALEGPAMMPGGDLQAWERLAPVLRLAAAQSDHGPCVAHCGAGGAGHFVKMVHNGIEYADMQLLAEAWSVLRRTLKPVEVAQVFEEWRHGPLASFLVDVSALVLSKRDPKGRGPLVDQIVDAAGQKGTGRWTVEAALELGIPVPTICAALEARGVSSLRSLRSAVAAELGESEQPPALEPDDLENALHAARIAAYAQGFQLLAEASRVHSFGTDLASVARIWTAGCILRGVLLERLLEAFQRKPDLPLLLLDPDLAEVVVAARPALRRVVAECAQAGVPVPAFSSALAWLDGMALARGSAALIQAQRDCFGAHTYRRVLAPDQPVHTLWSDLEDLG
ncbi:MAG: NADP-dependent phosphogluconate dehydrogenase [Deltaproteobacteria bacterium]|nr:NADP-dependent phosphogluconate dehydrogenase [Deltaproteobacteria bacterium]